MIVWFAALGLVVGALVAEGPGALLGGVLGLVLGWLRHLRAGLVESQQAQVRLRDELNGLQGELTRLQARLQEVTQRFDAMADAAAAPETIGIERGGLGVEPAGVGVEPVASMVAAGTGIDANPTAMGADADRTTAPQLHPPGPIAPATPVAARAPVAAPGPSVIDSVGAALREWFFGGNTVVRAGIIVLLVGLTMLLKYAADHALFPIELRLASAAAVGVGLVLFGLRQRNARPGFSITLQGGGIAATYLVVFFAYRTYGLLPSALAFVLLAFVAAVAAGLALAQDAMALVVIGQIGGFLAPVLASSGSGNHVALFSYYLLLNVAIFAIALRRAYRLLNVVGFVFTFGIGTAWGVLKYRAEDFATTEPFLVAFFLLYVAIPVAYAWRNQVRGWVDGSLVFGAPLGFLALQRALVDDIPFGMAYTTLSVAVLYLGLSRVLLRRAPDAMRAMSESFLALAIGFGTLAIPYGFDNAGLTGATWAIEGAGVYWLGVRQQRAWSRFAGSVLQVAAGVALAMHVFGSSTPSVPFANTRMLGAILLAFGGATVAAISHRHRDRLPAFEWRALQMLIPWGLLFLLPSVLSEVDHHLPATWEAGAAVGAFGLVGLAYELSARAVGWQPGRYPAAGLVFLVVPIALAWHADEPVHLLAEGGWLGWPIYFASVSVTLRCFVAEGPQWLRYLHPLALWSAIVWLSVLCLDLIPGTLGLSRDWAWAAVALLLAAGMRFASGAGERSLFPRGACPGLYAGLGALGLAGLYGLFVVYLSGRARGEVAPLPYVPVANPLDVAQLLGLFALLGWARTALRREVEGVSPELVRAVPALGAGLGFLWFNAMLARSVHQFTGVAMSRMALFDSVAMQVCLSVSWTVIALILTVFASRSGRRSLWLTGAGLLAVVVVKLFLIDLAQLSTIAKIGTFLVVGLLLLAVGYLAPVPPSRPDEAAPGEPEPVPSPEPAEGPAAPEVGR